MRFYDSLLIEIDEYQINHFIPFRNVAILELIRLGLYHQSDSVTNTLSEYGTKQNTSFKQLNLSYPKPLLDKIDDYQEVHGIKTKSKAITNLIKIGLKHPF